ARAELGRRGVLGPPAGIAPFLAAPTLLAHGTDDQLQRFMPGIAKGTDVWCQLFSEPGSGSDLASLATRAERDGDEYVVTGQKVWNTGAQYADWAILMARTDVDQPKHKGISYFAFDMRQPGVEVRPLKEMTGGATFNEVFLTEARVPASNLLSSLGEGWRVAMTTLSHERDNENPAAGGGGGTFIGRPDLSTTVAEFMKPNPDHRPDGFEIAMSGGVSELPVKLARQFGVASDPVTRQAVVDLWAHRQLMKLNGQRAKARSKQGQPPGAESSTGKLMGSDYGRKLREVGLAIEGPHGQLVDGDAPLDGIVQSYGLFQPAMSIAGGTDEVQRNIIGERVLGLPKEPDVSRDVAWRDIKVGTQRHD
ncbi:MAG: acyl-CoA dehydrogenase family protein, partial [Actinomycetota bacterium]|nr:acyl-CoA dehydrogenase family protein [Actinomycetota bacterium]